MKLSLLRSAAAVAIAAAALLAAPAAAQAYGEEPELGAPIAMPTVAAGTFAPNESVTVLLSGEDANFAQATQGIVRAAYVANANVGSVTSSSTGGLSYAIALPSTATGTYSVVLNSASGVTVTQSLSATGATGGTSTGGTGTNGSALPPTGLDSNSLLGLWVGGGALVLAGGAVAVAAAVHRQRRNADA